MKLNQLIIFASVLAIVKLDGNVTLATASVNGQLVDTTSPTVQADLRNKSSSLYISLVNKYQPKVRSSSISSLFILDKVTLDQASSVEQSNLFEAVMEGSIRYN